MIRNFHRKISAELILLCFRQFRTRFRTRSRAVYDEDAEWVSLWYGLCSTAVQPFCMEGVKSSISLAKNWLVKLKLLTRSTVYYLFPGKISFLLDQFGSEFMFEDFVQTWHTQIITISFWPVEFSNVSGMAILLSQFGSEISFWEFHANTSYTDYYHQFVQVEIFEICNS